MRGGALLCALATGVLACARPFAPPGGERDVVAPRLVETVPAPLAVIEPGTAPAVIRFDERLSERGFSAALVSVSPLDSTLRVERSGSEVRISIDGGWRPNRVYRVVLLPGASDLFGNARRESVELVFSTGAPVGSTALAGVVIDRLTGAGAPQGVVDAVHLTENARYTAIADSSGFYSLRYLPIGAYEVRAYEDLNRNRRRDAMEPVDSGHTALFAQPTDTVALVFHVLVPDTTAPRVTSARGLDSLHVRVEMDDYFDPAAGLAAARAAVTTLPDSTPWAVSTRVMAEAAFTAERDAARLAADSAAPSADTAAAVRDTMAAAAPVPVRPGVQPGGDPIDPALPTRALVVRLDRPLMPGTHTISIFGVTNLHGLTGNGTTQFELSAPEPPPAPPPASPDTIPPAGRS